MENRKVHLTELLDCALDKGVTACGDLTLSVAGVDLVFVGLKVLLSSADASLTGRSAARSSPYPVKSPARPPSSAGQKRPLPGPGPRLCQRAFHSGSAAREEAERTMASSPDKKIEMGERRPERGLAKLVLTVVELVRKLMEKQAVRKVEGGGLSDEEIERLGNAFMKIEEKMVELKKVFGLEGEELELDLGPLGRLT